MVSMTNETMVQYLKDYAYIQNFVIKNCKNSIYEEFIKYMISSGDMKMQQENIMIRCKEYMPIIYI